MWQPRKNRQAWQNCECSTILYMTGQFIIPLYSYALVSVWGVPNRTMWELTVLPNLDSVLYCAVHSVTHKLHEPHNFANNMMMVTLLHVIWQAHCTHCGSSACSGHNEVRTYYRPQWYYAYRERLFSLVSAVHAHLTTLVMNRRRQTCSCKCTETFTETLGHLMLRVTACFTEM